MNNHVSHRKRKKKKLTSQLISKWGDLFKDGKPLGPNWASFIDQLLKPTNEIIIQGQKIQRPRWRLSGLDLHQQLLGPPLRLELVGAWKSALQDILNDTSRVVVSGLLDEREAQIAGLVGVWINHLGFSVHHLGHHEVWLLHISPTQITLCKWESLVAGK